MADWTPHSTPHSTPGLSDWTPDSWRQHPARQQPDYADAAALARATSRLRQLPPLVSVEEIRALQAGLADAAAGHGFVLQGGDCAESFADCNTGVLQAKLRLLALMRLVLTHGLRQPVLTVARMAGQYAKPRSEAVEQRDGLSLPVYRGDLINGAEFDAEARQPDPQRLLTGYSLASLTLNYLRALSPLRQPPAALLGAGKDFAFLHRPAGQKLRRIVEELEQALHLAGNLGAAAVPANTHTCHEALLLPYEAALTRRGEDGRWYNLSTHLPWLGMRTADLQGAHVEYLRGISNPLAIKIGPAMSADTLLRLAERLNPQREAGRLTLIHRLGARELERLLPPLVQAMQRDGQPLLWICDPMHGNTRSTASGIKTRHFADIRAELLQAAELHQALGSRLGGLHVELTGDAVTECTGGLAGLTEQDLGRAYQSLVDPRLNAEQALELVLAYVDAQGRQAGKRPHVRPA